MYASIWKTAELSRGELSEYSASLKIVTKKWPNCQNFQNIRAIQNYIYKRNYLKIRTIDCENFINSIVEIFRIFRIFTQLKKLINIISLNCQNILIIDCENFINSIIRVVRIIRILRFNLFEIFVVGELSEYSNYWDQIVKSLSLTIWQ